MIKLALLVVIGAVATFAAVSPVPASANYPYQQNTFNPYRNNNYNYDSQYRNDPFRRNNYYNNDYNSYNNRYNPYNSGQNQYNNRYNPYNNNYNQQNYKYNTGAEANARILAYQSDIRPDGSYEYSYNTDNGISAAESGVSRYIDQENGAQSVQGYFQYTSPEGVPVYVQYVADENGFRPEVTKNGVVVGTEVARQVSPSAASS